MKSVYSFSCTSMLVAACLFCGCSRENAKAPGSGASAPKSYEPLVGTNAFAVAVCDDRKAHSNQPLLAFCDLVGKKSREITDAISAEFPDKVSEKLAKYYGMSCDDAIRHFYGVEPSDIKWRVCALEKFDPAAIAEGYPTNFVAPHLYAAVHSARPLDLDKIVAAYREFFEALRDPGSEASNAVAQAYGECEKYVSCERLEIGGAPAYRLSLTDPESGEKINGISPLATTICGGNLLVFAISDATLAHVKGLYAGTEPSAPADSAMGRELAIPDDILFRVAVTDIDKFVPALGKDGDGDDGDDGEDGSDLDNLVGARLDVGFDSGKTNLFIRAAADFREAGDAARIAQEAQERIAGSMMFVQMMLSMKPEFAFAGRILQTLQVANAGDTLSMGLSIPYSAIEGIDSRTLSKSMIEAKKSAPAPILPFDHPDDGDCDGGDGEDVCE